jgi:hypothetical protein
MKEHGQARRAGAGVPPPPPPAGEVPAPRRWKGLLPHILLYSLSVAACAPERHVCDLRLTPLRAVNTVLDSLHHAASKADEHRYFDLFADDAIFYGTDDAERWTKDQFRAYAHPYFTQGKGWTYTVADRHIFFSTDRRTAWFDERLDNAKWGRCRGSGVLLRTTDGWKIAQYNLTVPIPNDLLPEVAERIKAFDAK